MTARMAPTIGDIVSGHGVLGAGISKRGGFAEGISEEDRVRETSIRAGTVSLTNQVAELAIPDALTTARGRWRKAAALVGKRDIASEPPLSRLGAATAEEGASPSRSSKGSALRTPVGGDRGRGRIQSLRTLTVAPEGSLNEIINVPSPGSFVQVERRNLAAMAGSAVFEDGEARDIQDQLRARSMAPAAGDRAALEAKAKAAAKVRVEARRRVMRSADPGAFHRDHLEAGCMGAPACRIARKNLLREAAVRLGMRLEDANDSKALKDKLHRAIAGYTYCIECGGRTQRVEDWGGSTTRALTQQKIAGINSSSDDAYEAVADQDNDRLAAILAGLSDSGSAHVESKSSAKNPKKKKKKRVDYDDDAETLQADRFVIQAMGLMAVSEALIKSRGSTLLHWAALRGSESIVECITDTMNILDRRIQRADGVVHEAKDLLQHKRAVFRASAGSMPVHVSLGQSQDLAKLDRAILTLDRQLSVVRAAADIDNRDIHGLTALHIASLHGNVPVR